MNDNVKILSGQIELAEKENNGDLRLKMLICPLDVVNGNGVRLESSTINDWVGTLVNQPLQAKINRSGDDFEGHAAKVVTEIGEDGQQHKRIQLGTYSYGTFTDVSIENNNIIAMATVWAERYPTVGSIIERRLENGGVRGSWEIAVNEAEFADGVKSIKNGRFLGFALLGEKVQPAYSEAGILSVAELDESIDEELAAATLTDNVEELSEEVKDENEIVIGQEEDQPVAEEPVQEQAESEPVVENSAITDRDLRDGIERAYHDAFGDWPWVCYLFVDDHLALLKTAKCENELMYESIAYDFNGEDVILTPEGMVQLVVSPLAINEEVERRDGAIAEASAKIAELTEKIAELTPFKEEADRIRAEKEAQELAKKRDEIGEYIVHSGLVTKDELANEDIAGIIEKVDYAAAKMLIAERFIASLAKEPENTVVAEQVVKADLNANEHISGRAFVKAYLGKN